MKKEPTTDEENKYDAWKETHEDIYNKPLKSKAALEIKSKQAEDTANEHKVNDYLYDKRN